MNMAKRTVVIGIGGPVGSGKTLLVERLTRRMSDLNLAVITNDIYTKEDALFLAKNSNLGEDRIIGVETGGCPHTAIREDASMNFEAIETLQERFNHDLDVIFLESGGDNLAATFSPDLVDFTIYIIDVAQGEKIPRKAGQGMIKSDLFLINKTDLAPYVGANLDRMREDTLHFRQEDSFVFTNLNNAENVKEVENWVRKHFLLEGL
ncbi:urease accessory protein UreG [Streptococcus infantarius subsp. infantarius ATCC BAA-102]|nr:urease accessory protein UreG [Streptococcus infantarius]EDT46814.1 urease accessory protein UreG [Streptococcus infantarius subsp. infantarius ATCC BAA-102]